MNADLKVFFVVGCVFLLGVFFVGCVFGGGRG